MRLRRLTVLALFAAAPPGFAESGPYRMPPKAIADIADAAPTPSVALDPSGAWLLVVEHSALSSVAELAQDELRLAGIRLNPATNARSRRERATSVRLVRVADGSERAISGLPSDPRIDDIVFSPDGAHFAFSQTTGNGMELWTVEVATASAKRIASGLNGVFGDPFSWRSEGRSLLARTVPRDRGTAPSAPLVPEGPVVQETSGEAAAAWTYQDLLETPHDEALFEFYGTSQIVQVDLDGNVTPLGSPGLASRSEPSPDGEFVLVERLERPFSYLVPHYRFARRVEIWDRSGKLVREVARTPLAESVPLGRNGVPTGARGIEWRPDEDATLFWVEAQDGGDPKADASVRDKLFSFAAPFGEEPRELASLGLRFAEALWGEGGGAIIREWWWADRHERLWKLDPSGPSGATVLFDYSYEDRYNVPGRPLVERNARGAEALVTADGGNTIFLAGEGASPEGNRPFIDALHLETGEKTRLFQSEAPFYEYPVAFVDVGTKKLLTRRESREEPPNYFVRELTGDGLHPLTKFPHPYPGLSGATRELVRYDRADGVKLTATLHLPPGYARERDGALPLFVWAYPREFKSADAAGQVTESPYRFPRVSWGSPLYWLTQGYAIMENATMPIVGEGKVEPNDTYVEQLVASAQAAVDEAARRGVADPNRAAIGGHSYGAFMTANLLAHSDIFRAGIARSGAYNRSLTPFGFQSEQRTFWEATDIYVRMSPFMHVDRVNEPILLIHGEADNNSGTFTVQSERFFHALKGHGATARLVLLPHESHGYRGRESVMHTLWEMNEWLEKYVKHAPPPKETSN